MVRYIMHFNISGTIITLSSQMPKVLRIPQALYTYIYMYLSERTAMSFSRYRLTMKRDLCNGNTNTG